MFCSFVILSLRNDIHRSYVGSVLLRLLGVSKNSIRKIIVELGLLSCNLEFRQ